MSRYRGSGNFAYADPAPPARWDAERFARERDYREVDEYYQPAPPPPRRAPRPVYEEERYYYEDDRYGPRGQQVDRRFFEEEEYYDPRQYRGQMIPYRPRPPPRPEAPPRPGLLRRQSSLDTFDRAPSRRYDDYDGYRPPPRPQRINIDVPPEPSPRSNRYSRPSRQSRQSRDYYDYESRDYYDDVAIQDPDYYGDDGFREYREREWIRSRARDDSEDRSVSRSRPATEAPAEEKEEVKEEKKEVVRKESIKEEFKEKETVKEKPYPRRGKTKMPKRLVHTKVLFDLGYPFYEEGEKTIIIEKALGPENIDEVFTMSREYREKEVSSTLLLEAPPAPPQSAPPPSAPTSTIKSIRVSNARGPSVSAPSVREEFKEDVFSEKEFSEKETSYRPLSEAPRSVREWDQLTVKEDDRSVRSSDRRRSTRSKSRARSEVDDEVFVERKSTVIEREPSPSPQRRRRRHRSKSKSRRRTSESSFDETEIIERKIVTEEDGYNIGSDPIAVGPLALAIKENRRRSDREIKEDIRQLQAEQRGLRRERAVESDFVTIDRRERRSDNDFAIIERREPERSRSPSLPPITGGEIILERRGDEVVEIRKDRRERSPTRVRAPSAGLIKSMFYTVT